MSPVMAVVDGGASDLFLLAESRHGLPVAASLTVMELPLPSVDLDLHEVAGRLAEPGAHHEVVTLPRGRSIRLRRRLTARFATGPEADEPKGVPTVVVEYVVPVPASGDQLLFTFASPNPAVPEAMVALFDAMAGSLRWAWPA
jgi:hypothetical protein